jgi:predicted enzyme related to lactoylglutathione lyase
MSHPINWFEIPTSDLDRATRFWETVLVTKLKREKFGPQDLAIFERGEDKGVAGALVRDERGKPSANGTVVYLDARGDLDGCIARAGKAGGKVAVPKTDIGPAGFFALVVDTEGNTVGLHTPRT